jgi:hypothetical protein
MLNRTGIHKETATAPVQILYNVQNQMSVSILVDKSTASVTEDGRSIVKAGTPLAGDLTARDTAFKAGDSPVGVLLHDVDITDGNANGTLLIWGFVNVNRLDSATKALATAAATSLAGKITFLAD